MWHRHSCGILAGLYVESLLALCGILASLYVESLLALCGILAGLYVESLLAFMWNSYQLLWTILMGFMVCNRETKTSLQGNKFLLS